MNRANNPAFTWSNTFFLSRQQNRNLHPESTTKSHLHKKHFEKSLCFIPLSIPFLDTRSFCSVQESWNFPRRRIVAAFWEILISSLQRKGKGRGEGIGGCTAGGWGTDDQYHGMVPDDKMPLLLQLFPAPCAQFAPLFATVLCRA